MTNDIQETITQVEEGRTGLYIQAICEYHDIFGERRELQFRYVYGGRPAEIGLVMHAAASGNSAT